MKIHGRELGGKNPPYLLAEIGVNHNGDVQLAKQLIDMAKECGADGVKFQTFIASDVVAKNVPMAEYQARNTQSPQSQLELLKPLELSLEAHGTLRAHAHACGLGFLSTPHSGASSVAILKEVGVDAYKIGSGDLTNLPLLDLLKHERCPIILSTGMGTLAEVGEAVQLLRKNKNDFLVLHCTSNYPCEPHEVNMNAMETIAKSLNVEVGYSDHTVSLEAGVLATQMRAVLLEKHITLNRQLPGPDHLASLEAEAFKRYVQAVRASFGGEMTLPKLNLVLMNSMRGSPQKMPNAAEKRIAPLVRKSLIVNRAVPSGATLRLEDLTIKRPGTGIAPKHLNEVVGKTLKNAKEGDSVLTWEDLV